MLNLPISLNANIYVIHSVIYNVKSNENDNTWWYNGVKGGGMWPLRLLIYRKGDPAEETLKGISGVSRLFLYCFVCRFGNGTASCSFEEYAELFRLNSKHVGRAVQELGASGVVAISKEHGVDHRPKRLIQVDDDFAEALKGSFKNCPVEVEETLIRKVAFGCLCQEKGMKLTPLNRLFLSVLLSHSSKVGRVVDLGHASLSKLTGFSVDQRRSQVSRLADLGFLRALVPGVTGRYLFGSAKSQYFLNMGHPAFGENSRSETLLVGRGFAGDEDWLGGQAEALFKGAREVNQLVPGIVKEEGRSDVALRKVVRFERQWGLKRAGLEQGGAGYQQLSDLTALFKDLPLEGYISYLQAKINEYASELLSEFQDQDGLQLLEVAILAKIGEELVIGNEPGAKAFKTAILTASQRQAERARLLLDGVKKELGLAEGAEKGGDTEFVILPMLESHPASGNMLTLCVSSSGPSPLTESPYWNIRLTMGWGREYCISTAESQPDSSFLEEGMQVVCGLKAKAKRYPERASNADAIIT